MDENSSYAGYSRARLNERQVNELIGLARGLLADGKLQDAEIEYLQNWLSSSSAVEDNPLLGKLHQRIDEILSDKIVDEDERADLIGLLALLSGEDIDAVEGLKTTLLPLDDPAPQITFKGKQFSFTGTFSHGPRAECRQAVEKLGGSEGYLSAKTDYLVIGEYATTSWLNSAFGDKIKTATDLKESGSKITIISEAHWRQALG